MGALSDSLSIYDDLAYGIGLIDGRRDGLRDAATGMRFVMSGSSQYAAGYMDGYIESQRRYHEREHSPGIQ